MRRYENTYHLFLRDGDNCARAASGVFFALLAAMLDKWRGEKLFVACPDERRFRVYCAILRKHDIRHEAFSAGLSINIYL